MITDSSNPDSIPACGCAYPGEAEASACYCGVEDLLRVIRRRYSLAVLNVVRGVGSARFLDIERALPGASSSTLAETLRALTTARLIDRYESPDSVPRSSYTITESGLTLLERLRPLLDDVRPD